MRNNKEREEKSLDSKLVNSHKDFFKGTADEEEKEGDKEAQALKKKRDKHLM